MLNALRYLVPLMGVLGGLWLSIASLYPRWSLREWQRKAEMLLGLSGMAFFGLLLYGTARSQEPRPSLLIHELRLLRELLAGVFLGIFVTLFLEGSFRRGRSRQPEPPPR